MKSKFKKIILQNIDKKPAYELSDLPGSRFMALSVILIVFLGFAVYSNSFSGKFIWDDEFLVQDNAYIKEITASNINKIFSKNLGAGVGRDFEPYRPIQIVTFAVDHFFWGTGVWGYHLTNVMLHISVALAIFWFINIIFGNKLTSLLTSIFYVVHPVHVQAVSYISGRADPLCALFMILALIFYIKNLKSDNIIYYALTIAFYLVAVFSREMGLIFPALIILYHYVFKNKIKLKYLAPIIIVPIFFILVRHNVLRSLAFHHADKMLLERVPGFFVALTGYFRILIFPLNLHIGYGSNTFTISDPRALMGIVIFASLAYYAFKIRNSDRLIFFGIVWFFLTLLPQSNLLYPLSSYMADHWLYLPSIGFFLVLAEILSRAYKNDKLKAPVFLAILGVTIFYSFLTLKQNDYWHEPVAFYERTLKYVHDNPKLYNNLANLYFEKGNNEKAISLYNQSIKTDPDAPATYVNLGNVYAFMGRRDEAIALYNKALKIKPNYKAAINRLNDLQAYHERNVR